MKCTNILFSLRFIFLLACLIIVIDSSAADTREINNNNNTNHVTFTRYRKQQVRQKQEQQQIAPSYQNSERQQQLHLNKNKAYSQWQQQEERELEKLSYGFGNFAVLDVMETDKSSSIQYSWLQKNDYSDGNINLVQQFLVPDDVDLTGFLERPENKKEYNEMIYNCAINMIRADVNDDLYLNPYEYNSFVRYQSNGKLLFHTTAMDDIDEGSNKHNGLIVHTYDTLPSFFVIVFVSSACTVQCSGKATIEESNEDKYYVPCCSEGMTQQEIQIDKTSSDQFYSLLQHVCPMINDEIDKLLSADTDTEDDKTDVPTESPTSMASTEETYVQTGRASLSMLEECASNMKLADNDNDNYLDSHEYTTFVQYQSRSYVSGTSRNDIGIFEDITYDTLPALFVIVFATSACTVCYDTTITESSSESGHAVVASTSSVFDDNDADYVNNECCISDDEIQKLSIDGDVDATFPTISHMKYIAMLEYVCPKINREIETLLTSSTLVKTKSVLDSLQTVSKSMEYKYEYNPLSSAELPRTEADEMYSICSSFAYTVDGFNKDYTGSFDNSSILYRDLEDATATLFKEIISEKINPSLHVKKEDDYDYSINLERILDFPKCESKKATKSEKVSNGEILKVTKSKMKDYYCVLALTTVCYFSSNRDILHDGHVAKKIRTLIYNGFRTAIEKGSFF